MILIAFVTFLPSTTKAADVELCRYGDVKAMFHSLETFNFQRIRGLHTRPVEQLYGATGGPCQYRLFGSFQPTETPPVQTFTSRQFFLGGIVYFFGYPSFGVTRDQAQNDIRLIQDHLYIIPASDDWTYDPETISAHERTLQVSAFRNNVDPVEGLIVSQQRGIIEKLAPGRYVSLWTAEYPGNPALQALHPEDPEWVAYFSAYATSAIVHLDIVP